MTSYLKDCFKSEKKVRPKEDQKYKYTKCFEKKKTVPQNIGLGIDELPFKKDTYRKIDRIPKAD